MIAQRTKPKTALLMEDFIGLAEKLFQCRSSIPALPFVKGLRFSAQLIYEMRKTLSNGSLEVDWGHIISPDGQNLSSECDVVIHKPGHLQRWNGHGDESVMDFKFITSDKVVAVISCKTSVSSGDIDEKYCKSLRKYTGKVFLFSEYCSSGKSAEIRKKAKKIGYRDFWCLYEWDKKKQTKSIDQPRLLEFRECLLRLK